MAEKLKLDGVSYAYPFTGNTPVLDNVNLAIEPGDVVCIAGRNGSGKSTLAQVAAGLLEPAVGAVYYDGEPVKARQGLKRLRKGVGILFQSPEEQLFANTVFQDISFGPRNRGARGRELRSIVLQSCKLAGLELEEIEDRSPFSLSQGEKRMVALAGVFALEPEILILDEPFTGLDYENKNRVQESLTRYRQAQDAAVMIITHELSSVWHLAVKFGYLSCGTLSELKSREEAVSSVGGLSELGLRLPQWSVLGSELEHLGISVSDSSDLPVVAEAIRGHIGGNDDRR